VYVLVACVAVCTACSTYSDLPPAPTPVTSTPPAPSPSPAPPPASGQPTVTITPAGLSPLEISIAVGQRVLFVNNDTRVHDLVGGPDPAHPDCPEVLVAGFLTPGQSRETGTFTTARTCEYHDHTALGVPAFSGRIVIR
jgi:plastocyanin